MTSLAVALAIDSRGPTALYVITDSRITLTASRTSWDAGQKTFASPRTPDVFGFIGDALFPPMILRQFMDQVGCGLILRDNMRAQDRHAALMTMLNQTLKTERSASVGNFSIFHGAREGEFMGSSFRLWEVRYDSKAKCLRDEERNLNEDHSYFVHIDGSGGGYIRERGQEWLDTDAEGTSRAAIWSFCNALHEGRDRHSGGPPQLVGIWRKGLAQTFGFWWRGRPCLAGAQVPADAEFENVSWFNHRFERCDGRNGRRLEDAQKHFKPKKLKS